MLKKILIGIFAIVLSLFLMAIFSLKSSQGEPPPILSANFTDLSKIAKISKFRSCVGHLTVPQKASEPRSNMKHYFHVIPEFNKPKTIEIYAPYDGYVADVRSDPRMNLEGEIWISPTEIFGNIPPLGVWSFSVQHIDIKPGIKKGDRVKAGELIGWFATSEKRGDSFDIVYGKLGIPPIMVDNWTNPFEELDSVFNHMSDLVFADFTKKGVSSKEDFIIKREEREKMPCEYSQRPYFSQQSQNKDSNWIIFAP